MNKKLLIPLLLCFFIYSSCSSEKKDWEKTEELNTIEAYEKFLQKHEKSEFIAKAEERIEKLGWEMAEKMNTAEAYEHFLQKHEKSEFAKKAKERIEKLNWKMTKRVNTIEIYNKFLSKYPQGNFSDEAKDRIEELEWKEANKLNSIEAYENYLSKYPNSQFSKKATLKIRQLRAEVFIGMIVDWRFSYTPSYTGLKAESIVMILLDNYPDKYFEIKKSEAIKWRLMVKDEFYRYKMNCKGWKVKLRAIDKKDKVYGGKSGPIAIYNVVSFKNLSNK